MDGKVLVKMQFESHSNAHHVAQLLRELANEIERSGMKNLPVKDGQEVVGAVMMFSAPAIAA
mgnify:CR=1 FL=1